MKEPQNFKGTLGEWEVLEHSWSDTSLVPKHGTYICTKSIQDDLDENATEEEEQVADTIVQANFRLMSQSKRMLAAMQNFCDRVEKGEVRSTKTYNEFKEIIKLALGE